MKTESPVPLLLDTHAWFWLATGEIEAKSREAVRAIQSAETRDSVFVSAISMWELAMLEAKGRVHLSFDPVMWFKRALSRPGIELEELSPEIAVASVRLTAPAPRDPSDRIIIATAMSLGAALVTADREIIKYCGKVKLPCLAI